MSIKQLPRIKNLNDNHDNDNDNVYKCLYFKIKVETFCAFILFVYLCNKIMRECYLRYLKRC